MCTMEKMEGLNMDKFLLQGRRVLITGATGLIGYHLAKKLLESDVHVVAMGRNEQKLKQVFLEEIPNENLELVAFDISNPLPNTIGNVDYIFHAASPISGIEIRQKPVDTIKANLTGTQNCLEYLRHQKSENKTNGKMIIFSSATVYGNACGSDCIFSEEQTDHAEQLAAAAIFYSESKRMVEVLARAYHIQYGTDVVIARMGYVYGYAKCMPDTAFYEFIQAAIERHNILLNNSGMSKRDNIYVKDVVEGLLCIAEKGKSGEAYNISSNGERDNYSAIDQIAHMIAEYSNEITGDKDISVKTKMGKKERNPGVRLNNTKIKSLGWQVTTGLREGIKQTLDLYMK